ncbi:MAG: hypothetical protein COV46_06175 [Deltaproteobacteria bacterium CG11_big_fil_rev_8_21_14_0_20_49_13]|nr:MAG: hypothetical protein COV46_06175 [Deltaproteobacteria bacterium CG11_big_fil_rev_8_21_14_0_20_49_13]
MKQLKITLIELPATTNGTLHGGLSDDVYSFVKLPSRATDLLAAIAKKAGYMDVEAINPVFNKVSGLFTHVQLKRTVTSDVLGISTITRTAGQSYELARYVRKINPSVRIIMGGPHASALPEDALQYADIVILNEGDHTFVDLLEHETSLRGRRAEAISCGGSLRPSTSSGLAMTLNDIPGIAFKDASGTVVRTQKRAFLTNEELSSLPYPVYTQDTLNGISHTVINTSRGCPYGCEYCAVIENFGQKYRFLSVESTIGLIKHTLLQTRKRIFFGDDNFAAVPNHTKALLEEILRQGIKMPSWLTQVRVESARDPELLKLMKRAGCERVCIGFESVNEETLKAFNKSSNVEKNTLAIELFHKAGISIHGMFIVGADTDTTANVKETADYAKKNRIDTVQFTYMVPLPGTKMTRRMEKENRVISHDWHLYDGHHVLIKPMLMTSPELVDAANDAWLSFYSFKEAFKHLLCGNEHWYNCMVRIWGRKLLSKMIKKDSYYKRSLASLEDWHKRAVNEYDRWSEKVDDISKDMQCSLEEKHRKAREEITRVLKLISEQRDAMDDYFEPYKRKMLEKLEELMQQRLAELLPVPA